MELRPFDDAHLRRSAPPTRRVYGRVTCLMRPCAIYVDVLSADREMRIGLESQTARANHPLRSLPEEFLPAATPEELAMVRTVLGGRDVPGAMVSLYSDEGGMEPSETRLLPMGC